MVRFIIAYRLDLVHTNLFAVLVVLRDVWYTVPMAKREWRKTFFACIRPLVRCTARVFFGASTKVYRHIQGPYVVLGNHSSVADAMLAGAAFVEPLHIVAASATIQGTKMGRVVNALAAPIAVDKTGMSIASIRTLLQEAKAGHSIGLYPEGNITTDGSMMPYDKSVSKLLKQLKLPVVLYRTQGGYLKKPKWAYYANRGRVIARVTRVLSADEVAQTDVDTLYHIVQQGIGYDAYQAQRLDPIAYKGKRKAPGIGRLLYLCPHCLQAGHFVAKGNEFCCANCHTRYTIDDYGFIAGGPFVDTIGWNRWQHERFAMLPYDEIGVEGALFDALSTHRVPVKGTLSVDNSAVSIGDWRQEYAAIRGVALHGANQLLLSVDKMQYRFVPSDKNANVLPLLATIKSKLQ